MCEAIEVQVKYDTKDENGETLREYNERFNHEAPDVYVPPAGDELWGWFWQLSGQRAKGDCVQPLNITDIKSWDSLLGIELTSNEFECILAMDVVYQAAQEKEERECKKRLREKQQQSKGR